MCHGSLTVKTLARKAGDPWFKSRLWRILIFSIFRENIENIKDRSNHTGVLKQINEEKAIVHE